MTQKEKRAMRFAILTKIADERERQIAKWGECQRLNDSPTRMDRQGLSSFEFFGLPSEGEERSSEQAAANLGRSTWVHVLLEEFCEAIAEADDGNELKLEKELVQCAAVIVQWLEDIELRRQERGVCK